MSLGRFQAHLVLTHKSSASQAQLVSAIAVSEAGDRLWLGLSDGQLEEHKLQQQGQAVTTSLVARKYVGKRVSRRRMPAVAGPARHCRGRVALTWACMHVQPITDVTVLEGAQRLAITCEGLLTLLQADSLTGQPVAGVKASDWRRPLSPGLQGWGRRAVSAGCDRGRGHAWAPQRPGHEPGRRAEGVTPQSARRGAACAG